LQAISPGAANVDKAALHIGAIAFTLANIENIKYYDSKDYAASHSAIYFKA